jgi:hypothetical protein
VRIVNVGAFIESVALLLGTEPEAFVATTE